MTDKQIDRRGSGSALSPEPHAGAPGGAGRAGGSSQPVSRTTLRARLALVRPKAAKVNPTPTGRP